MGISLKTSTSYNIFYILWVWCTRSHVWEYVCEVGSAKHECQDKTDMIVFLDHSLPCVLKQGLLLKKLPV